MVPRRGESPAHAPAVDPVEDWIVVPVSRGLETASRGLRLRLGGRVRWYLLSVVVTLLVLLTRLAGGKITR
jgi:hypothetical protein